MSLSSYSPTSYSPASLQKQPPARSRSGLKRLAGQRLPWGNTQEVVPDTFIRPEPERLRFWEQEYKRRAELKAKGTYKPKPMEKIDFHDRCDHEHYRHALWARRSQFWLFINALAKVAFYIFLLFGTWDALSEGIGSDN